MKFFSSIGGGWPRRAAAWVLVVGSVVAGCRAKPPFASPPPAMPAAGLAAAAVRVTLLWAAPVDLDLYVTDPSLETVYFANPRSQTGGRLEQDVTCATESPGEGGRMERAEWTQSTKGRYRVGVDFMEACGSEIDAVEFRVVIEIAGKRQERSGKVRKDRFEPVVLEFDVPGESGETAPVPSKNRRGS